MCWYQLGRRHEVLDQMMDFLRWEIEPDAIKNCVQIVATNASCQDCLMILNI
jgi:hypothetical protein